MNTTNVAPYGYRDTHQVFAMKRTPQTELSQLMHCAARLRKRLNFNAAKMDDETELPDQEWRACFKSYCDAMKVLVASEAVANKQPEQDLTPEQEAKALEYIKQQILSGMTPEELQAVLAQHRSVQ